MSASAWKVNAARPVTQNCWRGKVRWIVQAELHGPSMITRSPDRRSASTRRLYASVLPPMSDVIRTSADAEVASPAKAAMAVHSATHARRSGVGGLRHVGAATLTNRSPPACGRHDGGPARACPGLGARLVAGLWTATTALFRRNFRGLWRP